MRTNLFLIVFFALSWLLLMTTCEKMEVELNRDKDEIDTTKVDTTEVDTTENQPTQIILDSPSKDTILLGENFVNFRWHIRNAEEGISYNSIISYTYNFTDYISSDVGENTECTLYIPYSQDSQEERVWGRWILYWTVEVKSSEGKTYYSALRKIIVVKPRIILDSLKAEIRDTTPEKFDYTRNINVTFYWHIKNPRSEETYNYTISLEWIKVYVGYWSPVAEAYKYEECVVGAETEYTLELSRYWNWNAVINWSIRAESSNGYIYESDTNKVTILPNKSKGNIKIVLDYPPDDTTLVQGDVTFSWHPENLEEGVSYTYGILLDKGCYPLDNWIEMCIDVGEATEYSRYMSAGWWYSFDWAIAVEGSDGSVGNSEVRSLKIVK